MEESHSDINYAFAPHRSISSQMGDYHILSSLIEMKTDLSHEVRALNQRVSRIDEQISQICNILSPLSAIATNNASLGQKTEPMRSFTPIIIDNEPIVSRTSSISPEKNITTSAIPQIYDTPSFYTELNTKMTLFDPRKPLATNMELSESQLHHLLNEPGTTNSGLRQSLVIDVPNLSVPVSSSTLSRSSSSSVSGIPSSQGSRVSTSNKIAPAPNSPTSVSSSSSRHASNITFQPIINTRFNPGRSPKPKSRLHHGHTHGKYHGRTTEQSTVIDLGSPVETASKTQDLNLNLAANRSGAISKSSSSVFRRFVTASGNNERGTGAGISSSSTLLYPPTSEDERPASPYSSGNEDDDYRPLTGSSSKYYHQTPL